MVKLFFRFAWPTAARPVLYGKASPGLESNRELGAASLRDRHIPSCRFGSTHGWFGGISFRLASYPCQCGMGRCICCGATRRVAPILGALWGPVSVQQGNPYFVGATRPTIPVAELSTITHCLRMLRMASFMGTVVWGTDSMYALGIILGDMAASTEAALVRCARLEATYAVREWRLRGHHTPSHIGFPPNECADVIAMMGRLQLRLSAAVETMLMTVINRIPVEYQRETFSLFQALQWTVLDDLSDVLMYLEPPKRMANVMVVECASANVLTLHPQEKGRGEKSGFDSHRRAGHFLLVRLLLLFRCCGCMIARVSAPRQKLPCNSCILVLWQGLQPGRIFQ